MTAGLGCGSCPPCVVGVRALARRYFCRASLAAPAVPTAVDVGLLRVWRRRALETLLSTGDQNLLLHIAAFLGDVRPPPLAFVRCGGGRPDPAAPAGGDAPRQMTALAVDGGGEPLLAGVTEDRFVVHVWDFRPPAEGGPADGTGPVGQHRVLTGLAAPVTSLWLDAAADRAAAGLINGVVQIWALAESRLLASCVAHVLESTRWTTVGHNVEVRLLAGAPRAWASGGGPAPPGAWHVRSDMAGGATVASMDVCGTVCLWRDDAHPVMCSSAAFIARSFNCIADEAVGLVSARGLLICGLSGVVVGFSAPSGHAVFVLAPAHVTPAAMLSASYLLGIALIADEADTACMTRLVAFTRDGTLLRWDVACGEDARCAKHAGRHTGFVGMKPQLPWVLAAGDPRRRTGIAAKGRTHLAWVSEVQDGEVSVRWLSACGRGGASAEPAPPSRDMVVFQGSIHQRSLVDVHQVVHLPAAVAAPRPDFLL